MKRNGFTLIELLAVIVVLAIIALIATPIVLNIINNAKTSSNERSGELYIKAVENAIMKKQMNGTDVVTSGTYTVQSDGSICIVSNNVCQAGTTISVDVDGDVPSTGSTLTIDTKGVVTAYTLTVSGTEIKKGDSSDNNGDTICTLVSGTSKIEGAKYSCKVNDTDTFYFYVLSDEDDDNINLIMDRNICDSGLAATDDSCEVTWNSSGNNTDGPTTALTYLKTATNSWTNITYFNDTNYILVDDGGKYSNISLSEYHARMLKISDIYDGTESEFYTYIVDTMEISEYYENNQDKYYLFDNMDATCYNTYNSDSANNIVSCDSNEVLLVDGVHKEGMTHIDDINSYWMSSSRSSIATGAWNVGSSEIYYDSHLDRGYEGGIRPVITISKNELN